MESLPKIAFQEARPDAVPGCRKSGFDVSTVICGISTAMTVTENALTELCRILVAQKRACGEKRACGADSAAVLKKTKAEDKSPPLEFVLRFYLVLSPFILLSCRRSDSG